MFSHGIDITLLDRQEWKDLDFVQRYMSTNEYKRFLSYNEFKSKIMYAAGIWVLKEAIIKATKKQVNFYEIDIFLDFNSPISSNLQNISLSISFEENIVIGSAILH